MVHAAATSLLMLHATQGKSVSNRRSCELNAYHYMMQSAMPFGWVLCRPVSNARLHTSAAAADHQHADQSNADCQRHAPKPTTIMGFVTIQNAVPV
jgi:hypothetical protein